MDRVLSPGLWGRAPGPWGGAYVVWLFPVCQSLASSKQTSKEKAAGLCGDTTVLEATNCEGSITAHTLPCPAPSGPSPTVWLRELVASF